MRQYKETKDAIKKIAFNIEQLAKSIQDKLEKSEDFLTSVNELVRESSTLTFAMGEICALNQMYKTYNRDSKGRFTVKN
jgi:hypothetical protein